MLLGLDSRLCPDLLHALAAMGHGDRIALVDGNYPAASSGQRIIRAPGSGVLAILDAVMTVLPIEASYIPDQHRPIHRKIADRLPDTIRLEADQFYSMANESYAMVATSEPEYMPTSC